MTDELELGSRLERPIHFECKLNEPMHIGMWLLHPAAADHSVSISRQQVHRIFRAGIRPLSGATAAVATGRNVFVPSFSERGLHTYPRRSLSVGHSRRHVGWPTNWDPYQKATDTAPFQCPVEPSCFLAQVRAPIGRPVTVAMALPTQ